MDIGSEVEYGLIPAEEEEEEIGEDSGEENGNEVDEIQEDSDGSTIVGNYEDQGKI